MSDTICAISTSLGVSAISIIRVSGNNAIENVNKVTAQVTILYYIVRYFLFNHNDGINIEITLNRSLESVIIWGTYTDLLHDFCIFPFVKEASVEKLEGHKQNWPR